MLMRILELTRYAFFLITVVSAFAATAVQAEPGQRADLDPEQSEVASAMTAWIDVVTQKRTENVSLVLDSQSSAYYLRIKELALTSGTEVLRKLKEVDQLQVMFFRLMLEPEQLKAMTVDQLIAYAVKNGFIGMELRNADVLDEIAISGNTASGRLLKFGRVERPDKYRQYFVKENGTWLVSLLGERERLEGVFDAFVKRTKLSRSEAAFLILETRLMRKVLPSDFFSPVGDADTSVASVPAVTSPVDIRARFRVVSIRLPESLVGLAAVTLDDMSTGLKYVVHAGDNLASYPQLTLVEIKPDEVRLAYSDDLSDEGDLVLPLNSGDHLNRRKVLDDSAQIGTASLLDEAALGAEYKGQMMMQWRNTGLRGRPQLLQQAWLTPDFDGVVGPDRSMVGLRVSKVVSASFWEQIGLKNGDLLKAVNGVSIDTLDAWKEILEIAQTSQELRIRLERDELELTYRTLTIKPG